MPVETMARACCATISERMVFEKLFQDDQPIGGGGTAIRRTESVSANCVVSEEWIEAKRNNETAVVANTRENRLSMCVSRPAQAQSRAPFL